ncbi:MAG: hypothetical protein ACRC3H_25555 [Lachnospiraceae bacterium]
MGITILFIALVIIIITIAVIAVYYSHYTHIINMRLKEQTSSEKKIWPPSTVAIVTSFAGLALFSITILLIRLNGSASDIDDRYLQSQYDYNVFAPEDMQQGYLSNLSMSENAGYTKYEKTAGDIKFTYFISNESYDIFHPAFILFAEYIGTSNIVNYGVQGDFLTDTHDSIAGKGFSGAEVSDYICVVGNTSIDCVFQLSLYYYDENNSINLQQDKTIMTGNNENHSTASGTINIELDRPQE